MRLRRGKEAAKRVSGFISTRHQVHAYHVELTASQIYSLNPTGAVDFGGNEMLPAEPLPLSTHLKHSQDRYEWWTLVHGAYLIEYNETLRLGAGDIALIEPHERLLKAGGDHATRYLRGSLEPIYGMLNIASGKVEIKQNARLSTLRVFALSGAAADAPRPPKTAKRAAKKSRKRPAKRSKQKARSGKPKKRKAARRTGKKRRR